MKTILVSVASIVLLAAGFFIGQDFSAPSSFSTSSSAANSATSDYELNAESSENVYQQIVAGGWGTRDMLEVIANQTDGLDQMAEQLVQAQETQVRLQVIQIFLIGLLIAAVLIVFPAAINRSDSAPRSISTIPAEASKGSTDPDRLLASEYNPNCQCSVVVRGFGGTTITNGRDSCLRCGKQIVDK